MKPTITCLILGLFIIKLPVSAGKALPEAPSSLTARSESQNLAKREPVIIIPGGKGGGGGKGGIGKGGGKTGGGGKGGNPGDDDGAPGGSIVKDRPIDYNDFVYEYFVDESPTIFRGAMRVEDDRGTPDSGASIDLVDLASTLNIKTELGQSFTTIQVMGGGDKTIDGAITEMNVPAADTLKPGQKTVVSVEEQFAYRDYHLYETTGEKKDSPDPGYRSQTDIQATILIYNGLKPDIYIQLNVVNKDTQSIIKEGVEKYGKESNHASLTSGSGEDGMTALYHKALASDNLRPAVQVMERYPKHFEGRAPTQVDLFWIREEPDTSIISISFEKKE